MPLAWEAVTAYRAALGERTSDRVPFDWAHSQHALGIPLAVLGEQLARMDLMEESIAAFDNALQVVTPTYDTVLNAKAKRARTQASSSLNAMKAMLKF